MDREFDIIIAGAGSAGCVLANRLSADPDKRVLLLEAGGWDWNPLISIPMTASLMTRLNLYNWGDISESDRELNGRRNIIPHGKVVGGSSSINYMAHTRGHPNDYARWVAAGAAGWGWEDVLPYFRDIETWEGGATPVRGGEGELGAHMPAPNDPIHRAWQQAAARSGYVMLDDVNGEITEGFGGIQYTIKGGRRASSSRTFLKPVLKRPNLTVQTRSTVTRVLFEGRRAIGVEYLAGGQRRVARAADRTVLSLGAINTPHILMLSGVGPADHLRSFGIKPIANLPVGQNLEDHLGFAVFWSRTDQSVFQRLLRFDRVALAITRAYLTGTGPATSPPAVFMAMVKSEAGLAQPDLELLLQLPAARADYWFPGVRKPFPEGFGAKAYLTGQESLGEIRLASASHADRPLIYYNSLSAPGDLSKLRAAYKRLADLANSPELAPFRGDPALPKEMPRADAEIDAFLRKHASQQWHPASTCRMGREGESVLAPDLGVHGLENLYVVDASAMPRLVSGNPNVPIMMMAAKAADTWRRA